MATIFDRYNDKVETAIDDAVSGKQAAAAPPPPAAPAPGSATLSKGVPLTDAEKRKWIEGRDKILKARGFSKGGGIDGAAQRGKTRAQRSR
jgi:hypothetical protein